MVQSKYQCEECNAVFYTREDMEYHNRTIHSRYICDICGESLDSENEFEAHTRVMHPEIQQSNTE
jgi:predicted SprT family Zn-dependent metalloprotease